MTRPLQTANFRYLWDEVLADAVFIHDHDGRLVEVNRKACDSLGYTRSELLNMTVRDIELDFDLTVARKLWGGIKPGVTDIARGRHRRKDGAVFPVEIHFGLYEESGQRLYFCSVRDVGERLRAESVLRDRARQLRSAFQAMAEGLVLQTLDGKIIDANPAAETILGLSRDQLLGKSSLDPDWQAVREDETPFVGTDHPAMVVSRTGEPVRNQIMGIRDPKTGLRWISINAQPVLSSDGARLSGIICTFSDVTEQRRLINELRGSRERIRHLVHRLETVREDERRKVSRTLHERIAQDLFAIKLWINELATEGKVDPTHSEVDRAIAGAVDNSIGLVRNLANDLRPDVLAHLPLTASLLAWSREYSKLSGLDIRVIEENAKPKLDDETRLTLFRAAQELLSNVTRHARANSAVISLRSDPGCFVMRVCDDGIGTDPAALEKEGSLGLLGIQERLGALGGTFEIRRNEVAGTAVTIAVPLKKQDIARPPP